MDHCEPVTKLDQRPGLGSGRTGHVVDSGDVVTVTGRSPVPPQLRGVAVQGDVLRRDAGPSVVHDLIALQDEPTELVRHIAEGGERP